MSASKQFFRSWRRLIIAFSFATLTITANLAPGVFVRAEGDGKSAASAPDGKRPISEYTRIHPKTGLPVRVRSYLRRVVEPKAVAVRSHFRKGHRIKGHERKRPQRDNDQTKN